MQQWPMLTCGLWHSGGRCSHPRGPAVTCRQCADTITIILTIAQIICNKQLLVYTFLERIGHFTQAYFDQK